MKFFLSALAAASLIFLLPTTAMAGEAEDLIIAQVKKTYGIENIKSLSIYSDDRGICFNVYSRGQNHLTE